MIAEADREDARGLAEKVVAHEGKRVRCVILYGSRAQGTASPWDSLPSTRNTLWSDHRNNSQHPDHLRKPAIGGGKDEYNPEHQAHSNGEVRPTRRSPGANEPHESAWVDQTKRQGHGE